MLVSTDFFLIDKFRFFNLTDLQIRPLQKASGVQIAVQIHISTRFDRENRPEQLWKCALTVECWHSQSCLSGYCNNLCKLWLKYQF